MPLSHPFNYRSSIIKRILVHEEYYTLFVSVFEIKVELLHRELEITTLHIILYRIDCFPP